MRALGHAAADRWPAEDLPAVGRRSTLDLAPSAGPTIEGGLGRPVRHVAGIAP